MSVFVVSRDESREASQTRQYMLAANWFNVLWMLLAVLSVGTQFTARTKPGYYKPDKHKTLNSLIYYINYVDDLFVT